MNQHQTIMVVEDDADISDAIAATLEDTGYSVIVAANGQEALDKLRRSLDRPNLILLDLMMPLMDGWQFRAAQTADPTLADIPVVVLSAHVDVRRAAEQMAAVDWMRKPLDLNKLLDLVECRA
jgi:CheY-like chemotaxis protein